MRQAEGELLRRLRLAKHIAEKYKHITGIDTMAAGGSTAIGSAHFGSDLDMWATYSEIPEAKKIREITRGLIEEYGNEPQPGYIIQGEVNAFRLDGVDVIIQFGHNSALLRTPDLREELMGTPKEVGVGEYYYMVVLYDSKGIWKEVKAKLEDYPSEIGVRIIRMKLEELVRILKDKIPKAIITENALFAAELRTIALDEFARLLFAINKFYYKRLIDVNVLLPRLKIIPEDCELRLTACAKEQSLSEIQKLLLGLIKDTLPLIIDIYPEVNINKYVQELRTITLVDKN